MYVPLRAVAHGDGCEAEFERDAALVTGELALLKKVIEGATA